MIITFDRKKAMEREDVEFLNWDHPMVTQWHSLTLNHPKKISSSHNYLNLLIFFKKFEDNIFFLDYS